MNTYVGCCCAEDLAAMVQVCIDQVVGLTTLSDENLVAPTAQQWNIHYNKISNLLQQAVDEFAEHHGEVDAEHYTAASVWLFTKLAS